MLDMAVDIDDPQLCTSSELLNETGNTSKGGSTWPRTEHIDVLSPQLAQCSLQQLLLAPSQQVSLSTINSATKQY